MRTATKLIRKCFTKIYPRDSKKHINSVMETLTNPVSCCGKVFIHMKIRMASINSMENVITNKEGILQQYHDLYIQSENIFLADVFQCFRNNCLELYKTDPGQSFAARKLAREAFLKKTGLKLKILTDITNGWKRYQECNISCHTQVCKSQ